MNEKVFLLTEDQMIKKMKEFLDECDADELAWIVGETFGGWCRYSDESEYGLTFYKFTPDENYAGAFDDK
jgi:hypothetical protein